jgi:hypothetical protein
VNSGTFCHDAGMRRSLQERAAARLAEQQQQVDARSLARQVTLRRAARPELTRVCRSLAGAADSAQSSAQLGRNGQHELRANTRLRLQNAASASQHRADSQSARTRAAILQLYLVRAMPHSNRHESHASMFFIQKLIPKTCSLACLATCPSRSRVAAAGPRMPPSGVHHLKLNDGGRRPTSALSRLLGAISIPGSCTGTSHRCLGCRRMAGTQQSNQRHSSQGHPAEREGRCRSARTRRHRPSCK